METPELEKLCMLAKKWGYKPYYLAVVDGKLLEFISLPFVTECKRICIKVREFNNPDSIMDAMVPIDHILDMENI